jgi:hypothetical protein
MGAAGLAQDGFDPLDDLLRTQGPEKKSVWDDARSSDPPTAPYATQHDSRRLASILGVLVDIRMSVATLSCTLDRSIPDARVDSVRHVNHLLSVKMHLDIVRMLLWTLLCLRHGLVRRLNGEQPRAGQEMLQPGEEPTPT